MSCALTLLRKVRNLCPSTIAQKMKMFEAKMSATIVSYTSVINKNWRKAFLGLIIFCVVIFYFFPGLVSETRNRLVTTRTGCLATYLASVDDRIDANNVRVVHYKSEDALSPTVNGGHKHRPASEDFDSLGFVGNGRYGFILRNGGKLLIGNDSQHFLSLEAEHNLNPIHHIYIRDINSHTFSKHAFSGALVMDFLNGIGTDMQSFSHSRKCVTIENSFFFHREYSNLFVERIFIRNELSYSIEVSVESLMPPCLQTDSQMQLGGKVFCRRQGDIKSALIGIVVLQEQVESAFKVQAQSTTSLFLLTVVEHSNKRTMEELNTAAQKIVTSALGVKMEDLMESHKVHWNKIWSTGLSVGKSPESNAPSALAVNETLYHLLSSVEEPLLQSSQSLNEDQKSSLMQLIKHPDHTCFSGIPNIDALQLWVVPKRSYDELEEIIGLWKLTLRKSGCSRLLNAGLNGFYEAVVLSVFALQFSDEHLALKSQPAYFHRNMSVRHITYKDCSLNLGISLLPDGHAELSLASESCNQGFHLYACDAGCSQPQLLGSGSLKFPVFETVPHTPILYISESEKHLMELKRTIHYRSIHKFFSNEIAEDKSKAYNVLPTTFWVVVAFVIVAFHVFLVILLYREYWIGGATSDSTHYGGGYKVDPYYDYPSEVRASGGGGSKLSSGAGSFISNYSVPRFASNQSVYSKSSSFRK
ncbi:uncharacterized protein KIAA2013 homolog isoform X2 [Convolutriloba macropyga]|uniref:uncharacterized protein KIAA2013 homolog isoform X2 n=1 Tax=Convolutriloba macropyga TaxID=536237 RepID=UPI003F526501